MGFLSSGKGTPLLLSRSLLFGLLNESKSVNDTRTIFE